MAINTNNYQNQRIRAILRKYELVMSKGGKCEICGYDKNLASMEFHHIDPSTKKFQLDGRKIANTKIEILTDEVSKCQLLCSNCHHAIHHSSMDIELVKNLRLHKSVRMSVGKQCEVCGRTFTISKGKRFCSTECRDKFYGRDEYPTKEELDNIYKDLHSWQKVAEYFGLTRRIIQRIRKK